jgi:Bacterial aa3 type cytochrome c oxidase subunit IV
MAHQLDDHTVELGAAMDYPEHTATYGRFVNIAKWGALICIALMAAMAFGFFTSAGFISASILFLGILALAFFLL